MDNDGPGPLEMEKHLHWFLLRLNDNIYKTISEIFEAFKKLFL